MWESGLFCDHGENISLALESLPRLKEVNIRGKTIFVLHLYFARFAYSLCKPVECESLNKFQVFKHLKGFIPSTLLTQRKRAYNKENNPLADVAHADFVHLVIEL